MSKSFWQIVVPLYVFHLLNLPIYVRVQVRDKYFNPYKVEKKDKIKGHN